MSLTAPTGQVVINDAEIRKMRHRTTNAVHKKKEFSIMKFLKPDLLASGRPKELADFACHSCNKPIDLGEKWTCGSCDYENNKKKAESSPFVGCINPRCPHPKPTAMQCPHCKIHLVLDPSEYQNLKSHQRPYDGVAVVKSEFVTALFTAGAQLMELKEKIDRGDYEKEKPPSKSDDPYKNI